MGGAGPPRPMCGYRLPATDRRGIRPSARGAGCPHPIQSTLPHVARWRRCPWPGPGHRDPHICRWPSLEPRASAGRIGLPGSFAGDHAKLPNKCAKVARVLRDGGLALLGALGGDLGDSDHGINSLL